MESSSLPMRHPPSRYPQGPKKLALRLACPTQTLLLNREDSDWQKARAHPGNAWTCPAQLWHLGPTVLRVSGPLRGAVAIVLPVAPTGHSELHPEIHSTHDHAWLQMGHNDTTPRPQGSRGMHGTECKSQRTRGML